MTSGTRNLIIILGVLLLLLGYQVFFTDAYDGIFSTLQTTTSQPATPSAPAVSEEPDSSSVTDLLDEGVTDDVAAGEEPVEDLAEDTSSSEEFTPTAPPDARFRSEQLLRDLPAENPFSTLAGTPSALFDPATAGPAIPLFPSASASVLEDGDELDGTEAAEGADEHGEQTATESAITPATPSTTGTQSTARVPRAVARAPVVRLTEPTPTAAVSVPQFAPLFQSLAPAPLIRATRQPVDTSAVQLPTSLPTAPIRQLGEPIVKTPVQLSERATATTLPYFGDLAIYPVIAFTADNRHADPANTPRAARIRNLSAYFDEIGLEFTGTARGSVTVGVFRSSLTLGPVVLAVGQTLPETDIALTRLTTTEAEFTLGDQTRVLALNLRW